MASFEVMQVVPCGGQIKSKSWVRCASGNVLNKFLVTSICQDFVLEIWRNFRNIRKALGRPFDMDLSYRSYRSLYLTILRNGCFSLPSFHVLSKEPLTPHCTNTESESLDSSIDFCLHDFTLIFVYMISHYLSKICIKIGQFHFF